MKKGNILRLVTGLATVLLATTCLAGSAGMKNARMNVAAIETTPLTETKVLNKANLNESKDEQELIAMGRRIQEEAMSGVPVAANLKASIELSKSCTSGTNCTLQLVVENKGNVPVSSPVLGSITLGLPAGKTANTTTNGWVCGYADPKLTCASTGIIMQPGEKARFTIDWETPEVSAAKNNKVCFSLLWPGRPKDGVYRTEQIAAVQFALKRAGFEPGGIDGHIRPKTLQAIRLLREVANIPGPSQITPDLLQNLFGEVGKFSGDSDASDDTACGEITINPGQKKLEPKIASAAPEPAKTKAVAELPDLPVTNEKQAAARAEADKIRAAAMSDKEKQVAARADADKIRSEAIKARASDKVRQITALAEAEKIHAEALKEAAPSVAAEKAGTKPTVEKQSIPQPVRVIKSEEPKTVEAAAPSVKSQQAKPAAPAPTAKSQVKPTVSPKSQAEEPKVAVRMVPMTKETERLDPSAKAPASRTTVRSTAMPDAVPDIDLPEESANETITREESGEVYAPRGRSTTITLRDDRDSRDAGLTYRSSTAEGDEEYYEIDRTTGIATLKPPRVPEALQHKNASAPHARSASGERYAPRRSDRPAQRASLDKLPSGADIVAGWPYRK